VIPAYYAAEYSPFELIALERRGRAEIHHMQGAPYFLIAATASRSDRAESDAG